MATTSINLKIFKLSGIHLLLFFDFEPFLNSVTTCLNNPQISSSRVLEKHKLYGYLMVAIDHESSVPFFFGHDSSENCLENFIKELHLLPRNAHIYNGKCHIIWEIVANCV